ncbi:hypothetical protein [Thioclava dalianensis]|nr:hypothetical protein [Thioclava dalianensis]
MLSARRALSAIGAAPQALLERRCASLWTWRGFEVTHERCAS